MLPLVILIGVLLFLLVRLFLVPLLMGMALQRIKGFTGEVVWEVDEAGIEIAMPESTSSHPWRDYRELVDVGDHYLLALVQPKGAFHLLPKRAFQDEEQKALFLKMVRERVGRPEASQVRQPEKGQPAAQQAGDEIPFQGTLTGRTYLRAQYLNAITAQRVALGMAAFFAVTLAIIASVSGDLFRYLSPVLLGLMILLTFPVWLPALELIRKWRHFSNGISEVRGMITPEGVAFSSLEREETLGWGVFSSMDHSGGVAILRQGPAIRVILARQYFRDARAWAHALALCRRMVVARGRAGRRGLLRRPGQESSPEPARWPRHGPGEESPYSMGVKTRGPLAPLMLCGACGRAIRKGRPRFGPERVFCGHCGTTVLTGLRSWQSLSPVAKLGVGIAELIAPSGRGKPLLGFIYFFLALGVLWAAPVALRAGAADRITWGYLAAVSVAYLLSQGLGLWRQILEAHAFWASGEPPVWAVD
jgi:hypothetical protein